MTVTALSLFGTNTTSSTLATAGLLVSTTGAAGNGQATTKCGQSTGFSEIFARGTAGAWQGAATLAAVPPSGNGWLFDGTTLEMQQIVAGVYTPKIRAKISVLTATVDMWIGVYKLASDLTTFTPIGNCSLLAQGLTSVLQTFTFAGDSLSIMNFEVGSKLYKHVVFNITSNNSGDNAATIAYTFSNSATQGRVNNAELDTPGFQPTKTILRPPHRAFARAA